MNVIELEQMREKTVKASESNEKEPVYYIEYLNQPPLQKLKGFDNTTNKIMWTIAHKDKGHLWKKSYREGNTKFDINSRPGWILMKNAGEIM